MSECVRTETVGRVLVATLARPPVNAFNDALITELERVVERASADDGVAVLHLRSDERVFSAGADLALMREGLVTPQGIEAMVEVVRRMQRLFASIEAAPVVVLAEIGGAALGGGLELALACDLRVAALEARVGLPEVALGLLPGAGGTQRLTRLCGPGLARRLILGAEVLSGGQAERIGLVQWALPLAELAAFSSELAARYASAPKAALAASKRCLAAALPAPGDGYAQEITETRALYANPETQGLVADFVARRGR